jgi:hypothetical protein
MESKENACLICQVSIKHSRAVMPRGCYYEAIPWIGKARLHLRVYM